MLFRNYDIFSWELASAHALFDAINTKLLTTVLVRRFFKCLFREVTLTPL